MITIEKLNNGNYLIEGERDEMNFLKYQVYMYPLLLNNELRSIYDYLKTLNSFEQIEIKENQIINFYKLIEYFEGEYNFFERFNKKLKEVLIKNIIVKRYLAIEKLKNNIKVK